MLFDGGMNISDACESVLLLLSAGGCGCLRAGGCDCLRAGGCGCLRAGGCGCLRAGDVSIPAPKLVIDSGPNGSTP